MRKLSSDLSSNDSRRRHSKLNTINLITKEEINRILEKVDSDHSDAIEFSEFLTHSLTSIQLSHENVRSFFNIMAPEKH